jgi:hypothetical protein
MHLIGARLEGEQPVLWSIPLKYVSYLARPGCHPRAKGTGRVPRWKISDRDV